MPNDPTTPASSPLPQGPTRSPSGDLELGGLALAQALAEAQVSTPAYVYDLGAISAATVSLVSAFAGLSSVVAYAVKANTAGPVVRTIAQAGGGADVVSGAELRVALGAGAPPDRVVMSGVAKTDAELDYAITSQIRGIHAESVEEIVRIAARAKALGKAAKIGLRINPGVEVDTHAHVATGHDEAKFGIPLGDLEAAFDAALAHPGTVLVEGLSSHVGSQLKNVDEYLVAARILCARARDLETRRAVRLSHLDFGGGFGIDYTDASDFPPPAAFAKALAACVRDEGFADRTIVIEPGRCLVAPYGVLVSRVVQTKKATTDAGQRAWLLVDAGMNDLLRPALYQAKHRVVSVEAPGPTSRTFRVVGPVCESSDDFGEHPVSDPPPALVAFLDAGAYGFTMASEYNGRALPAEVCVEGGAVRAVNRPRDAEAWAAERLGFAARDAGR